MHHQGRSGGRSRLTWLLLAVTVPPALTLVWLGVQLVQQDRSLAAQRKQEQRLAAAQAVVHALERALVASERWLERGPVPPGMVRFTFGHSVDAEPRDGVLWVSSPGPLTPVDEIRFADAERLEFQGASHRAAEVYEEIARSPVRPARAGALLRLARVRRQQQQRDAALAAYRQLATIDDVLIAGAPADLQARRAVCAVLVETGRKQDLNREAATLEADLLSGRWMLDRSAWELTVGDLQRWTGRAVPIDADRRLLSTVGDLLHHDWRRERVRQAASQRRVVIAAGTAVTVISRADEQQATMLALSPAVVNAWVADATGSAADTHGRVTLVDAAGRAVAGSHTGEPAAVKMSASDTGLPWTVVVSPDRAPALAPDFAGRRRLLLVGLAAILLLLGGSSCFLWHVLQRELAVARLQTDFVAAVSHEFRTPLTALRHVTELLEESDDLPPERRRSFYQALGRSTERLHRLVETLLDFSRMEGGRKPYDLRMLDAAALVAQVAADFQRDVTSRGFAVNVRVDRVNTQIRADAEALTHALWNLLDNAVKYSPDGNAVDIAVHGHPSGLAISVLDRGLGIPAHERRDIFQRFVRGEQATRLGIKGTGLGLAMVSHVVQAHRGTLDVQSAEGAGSTFTIVLPAEPGAAQAPTPDALTSTDFERSEPGLR